MRCNVAPPVPEAKRPASKSVLSRVAHAFPEALSLHPSFRGHPMPMQFRRVPFAILVLTAGGCGGGNRDFQSIDPGHDASADAVADAGQGGSPGSGGRGTGGASGGSSSGAGGGGGGAAAGGAAS